LVSGTGRGFEKAPLQKHKRWRLYFMERFVYILLVLWLTSCHNSSNVTAENVLTTDSSQTTSDTTTETLTQGPLRKLSVIVLPPFDEIANEGISPSVQKYLETEISKDTSLTLIKFPYKDLMNVPYHNVFDKKYCKPITDKVDADILIMTKLEQRERSGQMTSDKWNLLIRLYNVKKDNQVNSIITGNNLSDVEINKLLELRQQDLIAEIKNNR
jgi:hypothetical protein